MENKKVIKRDKTMFGKYHPEHQKLIQFCKTGLDFIRNKNELETMIEKNHKVDYTKEKKMMDEQLLYFIDILYDIDQKYIIGN